MILTNFDDKIQLKFKPQFRFSFFRNIQRGKLFRIYLLANTNGKNAFKRMDFDFADQQFLQVIRN